MSCAGQSVGARLGGEWVGFVVIISAVLTHSDTVGRPRAKPFLAMPVMISQFSSVGRVLDLSSARRNCMRFCFVGTSAQIGRGIGAGRAEPLPPHAGRLFFDLGFLGRSARDAGRTLAGGSTFEPEQPLCLCPPFLPMVFEAVSGHARRFL